MPTPAYSHGGPGTPGWPAVLGTTVSNGNPITILSATREGRGTLACFNKGTTTVSFVIEGNGGIATSGAPPSDEWVLFPVLIGNMIVQAMTLGPGDNVAFVTIPELHYVRTRITLAVPGCNLVSYVPLLYLEEGQPVSAHNPRLENNATQGM